MKGKTKKIISFLLGMIMILSTTSALAEYDFTSDRATELYTAEFMSKEDKEANMPALTLDYLGSDETKLNDIVKETVAMPIVPDAGLTAASGEFLVGIKMANFGAYKQMASGISKLCASIVYNTSYIEPVNETVSIDGEDTPVGPDDDENYKTGLLKRLRLIDTSYAKKGKSAAKRVYSMSTSLLTNGNGSTIANTADASNVLNTLQITITGNADNTNSGSLSECAFNTDYLAIIKFKVKDGVTLPTNGKKVLGINTSTSTTISFAEGAGLTYNDTSTYWQNYLKMDTTAVDGIFPAGKATISIKTDVSGTETTLTDTIKADDTATTVTFADIKSKLTAPTSAPAGKYFVGWSASADGAVLGDSDTISITTEGTNKSVKVYAIFDNDTINSLSNLTLAWATGVSAVYGNTINFNDTSKVTATMASGATKDIKISELAANGLSLYITDAAGTINEDNKVTLGTTKFPAGQIYFAVAKDSDTTKKVKVGPYTSAKKTLTLTFTGDVTAKDYDGNTTATGLTAAYPENAKVDNGDTLPTIPTINYTFDNANHGSNKPVKAAFASGATLENDKYKLALPTDGATGKTGTINKANKTVTITTPTNVTYGAAEAARKATVTTNIPAADYTVKYKKSTDADTAYSTTVPGNAGTYDVKVEISNTSNYTSDSTLTAQYTIGKKTLNGSIVVTVGQIPGATAPYTIQNTDSVTFTANPTSDGLVGQDTVTWTVTGTVSATDIAGTGSNKTITPGTVTISGNDNYKVGTITATATITDKPVASWDNTDPITKEIAASNSNNTSDYLKTTVLTDNDVLPQKATIKYTENGQEKTKEVNLTWTAASTNKYDTDFVATSGTYSYTATIADSLTDVNAIGLTKTATVTVTAVTFDKPADKTISAQVGETVTLPNATEATKGELTASDGTTKVHYTIAWEQATVTPADTTPVEVAGTITYLDAPAWMTMPEGTSIKATVSAGQTEITAVTPVTPITVDVDSNDNATQAAMEAKLPATITVTTANGTETVAVTWTAKPGSPAWAGTGGKYTYVPTITDAKYKLATGVTLPDATITVTPVTLAMPTADFAAKTVAKGTQAADLAALGLTMSGEVDVNGTKVHYTVDWDGQVSDLDTATASSSHEFTGKLTFTDAPAWMTLPTGADANGKYEVKQTISVPADVKAKSIKDTLDLDKTINASDTNNTKAYLVDAIPTELPTSVTVIGEDDNEYTVGLTWTLKAGTEYTAKEGVYAYTATFGNEVDTSELTAPTAKITVNPVKANYDPTMFDQVTKAKNSTVTKYEDLGFITKGNATLVPAVEGLTVEYTVGWEAPSGVTFENVTKTAKSYEYKGTVSFKDAPAWLTLPETLTGTKTLKVQESEVSSGRGSASRSTTYAVTFSAGAHGTIVSGKRSITVTKDKVVTELPKVEAKEGYKFLGWSQDGGKTVINLEETPIIKTTTLTAVYEEIVEETPAPTATPLVNAKYTKPYASGYDGDVFLPENNITRAELATMIARLINGDDIADGSYRASFSDIPADAWYSKYVGYLESFGVLDGYEEDGVMVFKPEQTITRAEMAAVITRAQKYAVDNSDSTFWDVANDYWAKDYITTLAGKGIITGYADGSFGAVSPLTRAEAVVIINRLLDPSTAIVTFEPVDISGHWAEQEIILAVNERQVNGTEVEATPEPEETPAPEATADPEATSEPEADATAEPTATPAA